MSDLEFVLPVLKSVVRVLLGRRVFGTPDWYLLHLCTVGMSDSCGSLESVPPTVVVGVTSEDDGLTVVSKIRDSWVFNGVVVPVTEERWAAHILHACLDILIRKHITGRAVIFSGYDMMDVIHLYIWMEKFGSGRDVLWYGAEVDADGVEYVREVTFGMFAWAVRWGVISEGYLWRAKGLPGRLLAHAVSLCHGPGLVDEDVVAFLRCVVIAFAVSHLAVLYVSVWCSLSILTVCCVCLCVGE